MTPVIAEGHLLVGETNQVRGYNVTYMSTPSKPIPGDDVLLAFSIVRDDVDVFNVLTMLTFMKNDAIIGTISETRYPAGDFFVPFTFTEDGLYRIVLEAKVSGELEPIVVTFDQRVGLIPTETTSTEILDVNKAILLSVAIGVVPLFIGLTNSKLSHKLRDSSKGFITSIAFGIVIFSLIDLFGGASRLGIDFGLRAIPLQSTLLLAFALGLVIPFAVEGYSKTKGNVESKIVTYSLVYLFALAVAFHSFAEGVVIGFDLQAGYSFTFTQQSLQGTSFFMHKIAEGLVISIPVMLIKPKAETFILAGVVASIPLLVGISTAYLNIPGLAASYGFALGAGASTYVLFKLSYLSNLLLKNKMLIFSGIVIGLFYTYFAGWIHAIEI